MKAVRISEGEAGQRLDKFLRRYLPEAGSGFLYKMLRKKNILLNGKKASGRELLAADDEIAIYFSDETIDHFMGRKVQSTGPELPKSWIVHEDDHVLILNKPAGVLSQRAARDDVSLVEYLRAYLRDVDAHLYRPGVINRLDRNTSGLVLAAKDSAAARELSACVAGHTVRKQYLALASGIVRAPGHLEGYLEKDARSNRSALRDAAGSDARYAALDYRPVGLIDAPVPCTLLAVDLLTGRSHQIRAQLAAHGHPLAGDVKYGIAEVNRALAAHCGIRRQCLHAHRLTFPKLTGVLAGVSEQTFTAQLPEDLRRLLSQIEEADL